MLIRLVEPNEFDALGRITVDAYRDLHGGEPLGDYEIELRDVRSRQRDAEVFVALDDDGSLMGGVTYVPSSQSSLAEFDDIDAGGIRMLAVEPRYQGLGVGRTLVDKCISRAREDTRQRIILHSTSLMTIARAMYERKGFNYSPELDVWLDDVLDESGKPFHLMAYVLNL